MTVKSSLTGNRNKSTWKDVVTTLAARRLCENQNFYVSRHSFVGVERGDPPTPSVTPRTFDTAHIYIYIYITYNIRTAACTCKSMLAWMLTERWEKGWRDETYTMSRWRSARYTRSPPNHHPTPITQYAVSRRTNTGRRYRERL